MLLKKEKEELRLFGSKRISIEGIHEEAAKQERGWIDTVVPGSSLSIAPDATLRVGAFQYYDVTENAFTQFCNIKGVPTTYAKRCLEENPHLLSTNLDAWPLDGNYMIRKYVDDVGVQSCRAIVSERFTPISNNTVLDLMKQSVDLDRYVCNQAYLSPEKMHLRMVDFDNPIYTAEDRSPLYTGFCVNNNEVGAGSLSVRFFIYRFACKNGIVRTAAGGTMFQKRHVGLTDEEVFKFMDCFNDIQLLRDKAVNDILAAQKKILSKTEMEKLLEQVKKELHLTKEMYITDGEQKIEAEEWIGQNYGSNLWGVVNFVTEKAKEYSLDTRLELEMFADRLMLAA